MRDRLGISGGFFSLVLTLSCCLLLSIQAFADSIVIYGDSQHNPEVQRKLVQTILSFKPTIVFRVGDLVDNGNDPRLWKSFNEIHGPLLKTTEYFPALGNHEHDSPLYFENFPFLHKRRWYSIDRMRIHFVILDSNSSLDWESKQYSWLESDLAFLGDVVKFKIAIFHHPLFDAGMRHESDDRNLKPILLPLFEQRGIAAVFSGHSHNYQRFEYNGIYFIVTGGGGAHLDDIRTNTESYLKKFAKAYHFCLLTPEENCLRVRVIDIDSNIIDDFKIPASINANATYR